MRLGNDKAAEVWVVRGNKVLLAGGHCIQDQALLLMRRRQHSSSS